MTDIKADFLVTLDRQLASDAPGLQNLANHGEFGDLAALTAAGVTLPFLYDFAAWLTARATQFYNQANAFRDAHGGVGNGPNVSEADLSEFARLEFEALTSRALGLQCEHDLVRLHVGGPEAEQFRTEEPTIGSVFGDAIVPKNKEGNTLN